MRPRVTLHIFTSVDGKITGQFGKAPEAKGASTLFENTGFNDDSSNSLHFDGWIYGRITAQEGFGQNKQPDLSDHTPVANGDYVINQGKKRYYVSIDRSGKIGWEQNTASYAGQEAYVIEILSKKASPEYKNFLRKRQIPYLVCGEDQIDFKEMLAKLYKLYDRRNLMLGGGGILNWSFIDQDLVDEISLVVAPSFDGSLTGRPVFNSKYTNDPHPVGLKLKKATVGPGGALWLRYKVASQTKGD